MRLLVLSDLHVEIAEFAPGAFDADLVVLAGDIHNGALAPQWARRVFPDHPILMVAGNHEFYDGERNRVLDALRESALRSEVRFLENEEAEIDGVRFLGCTLWTDYRAFEQPQRALRLPIEQAMAACARLIADHVAIRLDDGKSVRGFTPLDAARLHAQSRAWLEDALARRGDGATVVVTHHLPSWRSVHPAFAHWVSNAGFVSDLDPLVGLADLWIHGHTHTSQSYRLAGAQVVCNPRGYPRRAQPLESDEAQAQAQGPAAVFENPNFDPGLVVEVRSR